MSYLPIQQQDSDSDSVRLDVDNKYQSCTCTSRQRTRHMHILTIYSSIVTTLLCVLLVTDMFRHVRRQNDVELSVKDNTSEEFETQLGRDPRYMSLDHRYDYLWEEDLNAGEDKVIELGEEDGETFLDVQGHDIGHPASISMFHQLHCLAAMRKGLQDARAGVDIGMDFRDNNHWPHCLDYLRKTIRCWADFTLERPLRLGNGSATLAINGVTDIRHCRRTETLYDFVREHPRYNDDAGTEEDGHEHAA